MSLRYRSLGAALLCAVAVAACGSSDNGESGKDAKTIVQDAVNALKSAKTVHLSGNVSGTSVDIDTGNGNMQGTIGGAQVAVSGSNTWIDGPKSFWDSIGSSGVGDCVAGKWVSVGSGSSGALGQGLGTLTNLSALGGQINQSDLNGATKKGTTTVNGQPVVEVDTSDGTKLFVATQGAPYPVEAVEPSSSNGGGKLDFSNWNQSFTVNPPSGAVDITQAAAACGGGSSGGGATPTDTSGGGAPTDTSQASPSPS